MMDADDPVMKEAKANGDRWQQYHKSGNFDLSRVFASRSAS